jgi:tetratricopeptide (TPR) repeat protein
MPNNVHADARSDRFSQMSPERRQFALRNLAYHLYEGGQSGALYRLMSQLWRDAHFAYAGSHNAFVGDVALAIRAAMERFPSDLAEAWRNILLYTTLQGTATQVSPSILRLLAELGRGSKALNYASLIQDPFQRCLSYVYIGEVYLDQGALDMAKIAARKALEAAQAEEPVVSRAEGLGLAVGLAAVSDDVETLPCGLALLEAVEIGHWTGRVLSRLAKKVASAGRWDILRQVLHMTLCLPVQDVNLGSIQMELVHTLVPLFVQLEMHEELHTLRVQAELCPDELYRAQNLAVIVEGFGQVGDTAAVHHITSMAQALTSPTWRVHLLGAAAYAFHQLGDSTQATRWMAEAMNDAYATSNESEQTWSVQQLTRYLAEMGRCEEAVQMAETIQKPQEGSEALRRAAEVALAQGHRESARVIARAALSMARRVDYEDIERGALHRPVEAVVKAAQTLFDIGMREEAVAAICSVLSLSEYLCDPMYGPDALIRTMRVLAFAGAHADFEQAFAIAVALEDSTFRDQATDAAVEALVTMGDFERALQIVERYQADGLGIVAEGLYRIGDSQRAEELVNQVLTDAEALPPANQEAYALNAVATELVAQGLLEQGRLIAQEALHAAQAMVAASVTAYIFANGEKALALSQIAVTLARVGELSGAVTVASAAVEEANPRQPRVRSSIKGSEWEQGVARAGNLDQVLVEVSRALTRAGQRQQAIELVRGQARPHQDVDMIVAVVQELQAMGQAENAAVVVQEMWQLVLQSKDREAHDHFLHQMVRVDVQYGEYTKALRKADAIEDTKTRASAYSALAAVTHQSTALMAANKILATVSALPISGEKVLVPSDFVVGEKSV